MQYQVRNNWRTTQSEANRSHPVTPCFPLLCSEKQAIFPFCGTTSGQHFFKFCRLFRWLWCFPFACCESGPHHGARRPSSNASPLLFHYRPIIIALATDPPVFSTTPWQGTVERWQFASPFAKNLGSACADAPRYLEHCGRTAANSSIGIVMSGRRPLIKGFFAALRLIVGAVMSSAC